MSDRKTFEYGGYHFTPIRKFHKKKATFSPYRNGWQVTPTQGCVPIRIGKKHLMITKTFIPFQQTKNVIFSAAKKMDCCMYQEKMNFLFTMNQNRKSGTLSPMPFHSPGMLLIQPKFPAVGKAEPRKGRRYGGERIEPLGAGYDPKAGYGALRQL